MSPSVSIVRIGLSCPLGLRSATAFATMKAKLNVFEFDERLPSATVSRLSVLDERASRTERMSALTRHALEDLLTEPADAPWPASLPTYLSLPGELSGAPYEVDTVAQSVFELVRARAGARAELARERVAWSGRAGVFELVRQAASLLLEGRAPLALVGGVDSIVDPGSLRRLESQGWLLDARNRDGRIPGEAACFLLLAAPGVTGWRRRADLSALELDRDEACFVSYRGGGSNNHGEGLGRCLARLRRASPGRCDVLLSAQPSESYWSRELSHAYLRNAELMPEPMRSINVADRLGDLGSAAGAVALARAVDRFSPRPWELHADASVVIYGVSDRGEVGAARLERPLPSGGRG